MSTKEPVCPVTLTRKEWEHLAAEQGQRNRHDVWRKVPGQIRAGLEKRKGDPVTLEIPESVLGHLTNMCLTPGLIDLGMSMVVQAGNYSRKRAQARAARRCTG